MAEDGKRIEVILDPELHDYLLKKAEMTGQPVSLLVNDAVRAVKYEDEADLAAFDEGRDEALISHEEMIASLKAHGKI